jgi:hypothetical protein
MQRKRAALARREHRVVLVDIHGRGEPLAPALRL